MGTYCDTQDVLNALTPGADPSNAETAASLPEWQIEDAIAEAEGIVGTYILARYQIVLVTSEQSDHGSPAVVETVTLAPYPVRGWTRDIAAYLAALTFRKNKDLGKDDPIRLRYLMAIEMLTAVRDGKMSLPGGVFPPTEDPNSQGGVHVENLYTGKLFGPEDFGLGSGAPYSGPQVYWPVR